MVFDGRVKRVFTFHCAAILSLLIKKLLEQDSFISNKQPFHIEPNELVYEKYFFSVKGEQPQ